VKGQGRPKSSAGFVAQFVARATKKFMALQITNKRNSKTGGTGDFRAGYGWLWQLSVGQENRGKWRRLFGITESAQDSVQSIHPGGN
jgi:hypothetical protein